MQVFEKIIERLKALPDANPSNYHTCDVIDRELAIEEVEQISEEYNNGWIPVSERLPEESLNSVIGWDEYRQRCCFVQYYNGIWKLGDYESVKITHWQPTPLDPVQQKGD